MSNLIYSILPNPPRDIIYVHPDVSVEQCVEIMKAHQIGTVVVTDDDNLLGIVSERDVVYDLARYHAALLTHTASDVLCAAVAVLKPSDTVETAMAIMTETKRRHVLVADSGKLIAIVSIGDVLLSLLGNHARVIEELEHYIHQ